MQDERLYELIEQYLEGTMTAPERESFEQLVNADQKVRDTLELHRELAQSLGDTQLEAFRQTLNEMDGLTNDDGVVRKDENTAESRKTIIRRLGSWRKYAAAALLAGVLITAGLLMSRPPANPQDLVSAYSVEYTPPSVQRSQYGQLDRIAADAYRAFENGGHSEAIQLLDQAIGIDSTDMSFWFFKGLSHMKLEHNNAAAISMSVVTDHGQSIWKEDAEWTYALIKLQAGELTDCLKAIDGIMDQPDHKWLSTSAKLKRKVSAL